MMAARLAKLLDAVGAKGNQTRATRGRLHSLDTCTTPRTAFRHTTTEGRSP